MSKPDSETNHAGQTSIDSGEQTPFFRSKQEFSQRESQQGSCRTRYDGVYYGDSYNHAVPFVWNRSLWSSVEGKETKEEDKPSQSYQLVRKTEKIVLH